MKIPTVKQCCCGIDLITAGKISGILSIVGSFISIFFGDIDALLLITTGVSAVWLYGLFKEKSNFMLPKILMGAIAIVVVFFGAIYLLIFGNSDEEVPTTENDKIPNDKLSPLALILILLIVVIPGIYFWIVEYSVYKLIKDNEKDKISVPHIPPKNEV